MISKKLLYTFCLIQCIAGLFIHPASAQPIRTPVPTFEFYTALATDDTTSLFKMLDQLQYAATNQELAYKGTLLMKKASTIRSPKGLQVFNRGKKMLDAVIAKENTNPEFRFLRLVIQENCPKQLNYHANIKQDAALIKKRYAELSPKAKGAVVDYSKGSKVIKPSDFPH